jgi:restriction endonuclease S subunit
MESIKRYSEVSSGYSFRNQLTTNDNLPIGVIQLRDVDTKTGNIKYENWSTSELFKGAEKYFLQDGDILLISKGNDNTAFLFEAAKCPYPHAIASSAFIVIRCTDAYINPAYLTWYLNLQEQQQSMKREQEKTTVPNLPIKVLQQMEVPLPVRSKQATIGRIYVLNKEKALITFEIEEKYLQLLNQELKNLL